MRVVILSVVVAVLSSCQWWSEQVGGGALQQHRYGLQDQKFEVLLGSIAVLPCTLWPGYSAEIRAAKFSAPAERVMDFCAEVDQFLLRSFVDQPHIHGKSPGTTLAVLRRSGGFELWRDFFRLWRPAPPSADFLGYYRRNVLPQEEWRFFLRDFQRTTDYSDAVLIPFLAEVSERRERYRGQTQWLRRMHMVIFLLSSENARMIWARTHKVSAVRLETRWLWNHDAPLDKESKHGEEGRSEEGRSEEGRNDKEQKITRHRSVVAQKHGHGRGERGKSSQMAEMEAQPRGFPPWQEALQRLFSHSIWRDFPGWIPRLSQAGSSHADFSQTTNNKQSKNK